MWILRHGWTCILNELLFPLCPLALHKCKFFTNFTKFSSSESHFDDSEIFLTFSSHFNRVERSTWVHFPKKVTSWWAHWGGERYPRLDWEAKKATADRNSPTASSWGQQQVSTKGISRALHKALCQAAQKTETHSSGGCLAASFKTPTKSSLTICFSVHES